MSAIDVVTIVYAICFLIPWVILFWPGPGGP
jgi:hypothetical protein